MKRKKIINQRVTTLFNMIVAIIISTLTGLVLGVMGLSTILTAGCVSVVAVLSEHWLTVNPMGILKYITYTIKEDSHANE